MISLTIESDTIDHATFQHLRDAALTVRLRVAVAWEEGRIDDLEWVEYREFLDTFGTDREDVMILPWSETIGGVTYTIEML